MKFSDYQSGRDQFGRKYPLKVEFKDGRVIFGHAVKYLETGDTTTNISFAIIENIEHWCKNINQESRERIKFDDVVIKEVSIFNDY